MENTKFIKIIIFFLIVFVNLFFTNNTLFANGVIWITNPANNHDYAVIPLTDWVSAESFAQTQGGHLVTINDQAENTWLFETFVDDDTYDGTFWIGFNDIVQEGSWVWSSGETPNFQGWCVGEPNDCCDDPEPIQGEENAAVITDFCGGWNDLPEWHHHYAIIEISPYIEAIIDIDRLLPNRIVIKNCDRARRKKIAKLFLFT
jgi:hypothetical protein